VNANLTALIDLGSSSVRLMLVRIAPGVGYRVVRDERARTRLGSGPVGLLSAEAVAWTVEAVGRFLQGARQDGAGSALAIATAAVREAPNAADLLDRLRLEAGLEVQVLTADEEARLGALAARASLQLREATVVDLGGCSLEVSRIAAGEPVAVGSAPLGVLRATERFLVHDPPTEADVCALRRAVRGTVACLLPRQARPDEPLIGIGGTARALARLRALTGPKSLAGRRRVSRDDLAGLRACLVRLTLAERRRLPGLKPSRADVIVAGAVVLEELLEIGGYGSLLVAEHGVRHGVLLRETFERIAS
jgi:exopolyphosphatase/guanosine-5'-triphosphate,3'-diphosphate pyrophosphatase